MRLSARQNARLRERLLAFREREGLSERALASKAGVGIGTVRDIGKTKAGPTLATLLALVEALRLQSVDQLLGPSPTALLTAHDQLEAEMGENTMNILMQTDQQH